MDCAVVKLGEGLGRPEANGSLPGDAAKAEH